MTAGDQKPKGPNLEDRHLQLEEFRLEAETDMRAADQAAKKIEEEAKSRQATFDRRYRLLELKERQADRALKLRELELNQGRGIRFTTAQASVAGAVLAVLGAIFGAVIQGVVTRDVEAGKNQALIEIEARKARANIDLENEKFGFSKEQETQKEQHELILKMISVGDVQQARTNLAFLADTGLVRDKALADRILSVKATPVLPNPTGQANVPHGVAAICVFHGKLDIKALTDAISRDHGEYAVTNWISNDRKDAEGYTVVKVPKNYSGPFREVDTVKYQIYNEGPETYVIDISALLTRAATPAVGQVAIDQVKRYLDKVLKGQEVKPDSCDVSS